jgi:hypothetical protein
MIIDVMYVPYNITTKNAEGGEEAAVMPYLTDVVITNSSTAGQLKQRYAKRLNVKEEDLFVITKCNDEIVDHLDNNSKLVDVDTKQLYTKIYDVPAPQDVPNPVDPIIKNGESKITNDELVELFFYVDAKNNG